MVGVCIPGTPGIVIGRNNYIAWGLTNVMLDDSDIYIEKNDSSGTKYLYNGIWVQLTEREEEINVRGKGKYKFKVLSTHRGPIISDVYNFFRSYFNCVFSSVWRDFNFITTNKSLPIWH